MIGDNWIDFFYYYHFFSTTAKKNQSNHHHHHWIKLPGNFLVAILMITLLMIWDCSLLENCFNFHYQSHHWKNKDKDQFDLISLIWRWWWWKIDDSWRRPSSSWSTSHDFQDVNLDDDDHYHHQKSSKIQPHMNISKKINEWMIFSMSVCVCWHKI